MTETQTKAEAYVRQSLPELMELSFGCEVKYPSQKRYLEADELDNPQFTTAKVLMYGENRSYDDTEEYFTVFNDWNEEEDLGGRLDEGELEIIGHPIQLQHWLRVLEGNYCINENGVLGRYHYDNDVYWLDMKFNLTTGQPATEADYQAFNDIVGI